MPDKALASNMITLTFGAVVLAGCVAAPARLAQKDCKGGRQCVAAGGIYKIGTPYQIEGEWYYPQENVTYDNQGIASWYGSQFHGKRTANGEIFDMELLTAAHPTLPMPVRAKVINLENGRSVTVRINDRGPFAKNREIDLSRRAAKVLGFKNAGTTRVRVQYLGRASLYDATGRLFRSKEPDRFIAEKPVAPPETVKVTAMPLDGVEVLTPDGEKHAPKARSVDISSKRYAVQVGVFSRRNNAERLKQKLEEISPVDIVEVELNDNIFYRVKIGGFNIRADARTMLRKVVAVGHQDALIIKQ